MEKRSVKDYFLDQLNSKNAEISKDDILNLAAECGFDVKPKVAKTKIIDMLLENGFYDKLFEYFNKFVTIPAWEIADYYNISTNKIKQLKEIGFIKEDPIEKEFYSRLEKQYFNADTYPLSILNYDENELKKAYDNAFIKNRNKNRR